MKQWNKMWKDKQWPTK